MHKEGKKGQEGGLRTRGIRAGKSLSQPIPVKIMRGQRKRRTILWAPPA